MKTYDVVVRQTIEYGSKFDAISATEAIDTAMRELKHHGDVVDTAVMRCVATDGTGPTQDELDIEQENLYSDMSAPDGFFA